MRCARDASGLPTPDLDGVRAGTACPVHESLRLMRAATPGSCGREVFCREGTRQLTEILTDLTEAGGRTGDLELVAELSQRVAQLAACTLAGTAAGITRDLLREHTAEWEAHLRRHRCTSLTCRMSFTVYVDPVACTGCGDCMPACPEGAIAGGPGLIHVVDDAACTRCLACLPSCGVAAIGKAGPVPPKLPTAPVPVGSFAAAPVGGMRRRRRSSETT
jgi:NAD-dependent dihydropyrimidine dehydrogenase PreA subunit